eukprot:gene10565-biopygen4786
MARLCHGHGHVTSRHVMWGSRTPFPDAAATPPIRHDDQGRPGACCHGGGGEVEGNRTVARAWRGHGAGVARTIGHVWLGVARAWRGHGAGVARACPVPPGQAIPI